MAEEQAISLFHSVKAASVMTGLTERQIKTFEEKHGVVVPRVLRGAIPARAFTPNIIFDLANHKRSNGNNLKLPRPVTVNMFLPKGGVGKSTLATELAIQWQLSGLKVLLVDLDTQANSSMIFGYDPEVDDEAAVAEGIPTDHVIEYTMANLLNFPEVPRKVEMVPFSKVVKKPWGENGPHLIPANIDLAELLHVLIQANNRDNKLMNWVKRGRTQPDDRLDLTPYDIVLFDSAPAANMLSRCAMVASDFNICPQRLDVLSTKSLSFINKEIIELRKEDLHSPELLTVTTFYAPGRLRNAVVNEGLLQSFPKAVIHANVRQSEIFSQYLLVSPISDRMPLSLRYPTHDVVTQDLKPLSEELVTRFASTSEVR